MKLDEEDKELVVEGVIGIIICSLGAGSILTIILGCKLLITYGLPEEIGAFLLVCVLVVALIEAMIWLKKSGIEADTWWEKIALTSGIFLCIVLFWLPLLLSSILERWRKEKRDP
jgi:hypothetical protein